MIAFFEILQPAVKLFFIYKYICFNKSKLSHISKTVNATNRRNERILEVWRERQIYPTDQLDSLVRAMAESSIYSPNLNSDPESPIIKGSPPQYEPEMSPTPSPETTRV